MCDGPASPCGGGQRLRCARPLCSHFKISASFSIAARACMARLAGCFGCQTAALHARLWFAPSGEGLQAYPGKPVPASRWPLCGESPFAAVVSCCRPRFLQTGLEPLFFRRVTAGAGRFRCAAVSMTRERCDGRAGRYSCCSLTSAVPWVWELHSWPVAYSTGLGAHPRRLAHISVARVSSRCGQASLTTLHAAVHHIALSC